MEKKPERKGLGRGLSALMADVNLMHGNETAVAAERPRLEVDAKLPIETIRPNPNQPRRDFSQEALQELSESIRAKGIIQPIVVRKTADDQYEIVAGERRWRAAQLAQLHEVPVVVRSFTDAEVLEIAIIENIQRADLNPVEEAMGFRQLMDRFGHTQEKLADALSKSRSHIANTLRLLSLPEDVQFMMREGKVSAGHARALIGNPRASELARKVMAEGLSVRDVEKMVREEGGKKKPARSGSGASDKDADTRAIEGDLSANLGMAVSINHDSGGEGGTLSIRYASLEDLDRLCEMLSSVKAGRL